MKISHPGFHWPYLEGRASSRNWHCSALCKEGLAGVPGGSDANLGSIQGRDAKHPWRENRKVTQRLFLQNEGQAGEKEAEAWPGCACKVWSPLQGFGAWKPLEERLVVPFPGKCTEQEDRGTLFDARMRSEKGGAASQPAPKKSSCIALSPTPRHHHNARTKSPIIPSQHGTCNPIEDAKVGPAAPRRILSSCPMNES